MTNVDSDAPDLVVTSLIVPTETLIGNPADAQLSWTVANLGTAATTVAEWTDRLVLSTNDIHGDADDG